MSKKLNTLIEQAAILRADVAERERDLRESKAALADIEAKALALMMKEGSEAVRTAAGMYSIRRDTVPKVEDWDKLYDYIKKGEAFEMLQRRISVTAWRERADLGEEVPGVTAEVINKLHWTGAK